jgi:hypothetical protein
MSDSYIPKGLSDQAKAFLDQAGYAYSPTSGAWERRASNWKGFEGSQVFIPATNKLQQFELGTVRRAGLRIASPEGPLSISAYAVGTINRIASSRKSVSEKLKTLDEFGSSWRQTLLSMPPVHTIGVGNQYVYSQSVLDLDARAKASTLTGKKLQAYQDQWVQGIAAKNLTLLPGKAEKFIYSGSGASTLMGGLGNLQSIRKYTTLADVMAVAGGDSPVFTTHEDARFRSLSRSTSPTARMRTGYWTRGLLVDPTSVHTAGTGAIFKESAMRGKMSFRDVQMTISQKALATNLGEEQATALLGRVRSGQVASRKDLLAIRNARVDTQDLLASISSMSPQEQERIMTRSGLRLSRDKYNFLGMKSLDKDKIRVQAAIREPWRPGTKFLLADQKTTAEVIKDKAFNELVRNASPGMTAEQAAGIDVLFPHFKVGKGEKADPREIKTLFQSMAKEYLSSAPSRNDLLERQDFIASLVNNDVKGKLSRAKALKLATMPLGIRIPGQWVASVAATKALMAKTGDPGNTRWLYAQPLVSGVSGTYRGIGRVGTVGRADIGAALLAKRPALAKEITNRIASNKYGAQYCDLLGLLTGQSDLGSQFAELNPLSQEFKLSSNIRVKNGLFTGLKGAALFTPEVDQAFFVNLPKTVSLKVGANNIALNKIGFLSSGATGLSYADRTAKTAYASAFNKAGLGLLRAIRDNGPIDTALQRYADEFANLSGKGHLFERNVFKSSVMGVRGKAGFLTPEQEIQLNKVYKTGSGKRIATGWTVMDMKRAQYLMADKLEGLTPAEKEIKVRQILKRGYYTYLTRPPQQPSGYAPTRVALWDDLQDLALAKQRKYVMGVSSVYEGYGDKPGWNIGVDRDSDDIRIDIHERAVQQEAYLQHRKGYRNFKIGGMVPSTITTQAILKRASTSEFSAEVVGKALMRKQSSIGSLYNLAESIMAHGPELAKNGRDLQQYHRAALTLFRAGEKSGIDLKRLKGPALMRFLDIDPMAIMNKPKLGPGDLNDLMSGLGLKNNAASKRMASDLISTVQSMKNQIPNIELIHGISRRKGRASLTEMSAGVFQQNARSRFKTPKTIIDHLYDAGVIRDRASAFQNAAEQVGQQNAETASSKFKSVVGEGVGKFVKGLKEGRGWGTVALGAVGVAGLMAAFRKPGVMIARPDQNPVDQRAYYQENSAAPIVPQRHETRIKAMTNQQHNVKIRVRDTHKRSREHYVNLSDSIAANTAIPTSSQVYISDDSNMTDYGRIFNREAMRQLR